MSRDDYGGISVISDEEREALGLGGRGRKPDDEEEGLFETLGKAGDKLGETKLGQKIGSILTVLILAFFGSGTADLDFLDNIFGDEEEPMLRGGCTDPTALNYKPNADFDNGSCTFPPPVIYGCMDPNALNYNPQATHSNNQCSYPPNQNGTNNETQTNETVYGCMDIDANNFNDRATEDDGSCDYENESNHCNHTELIVWDGLEYEAVLYYTDGNSTIASFGREAEDNLELYIDMDTNCNDYEDPLPVKIYYDIGHLFPSFDDNGTFQYFMYDNMTYDEFYFDVSGWEEDTHSLDSNAEPYEETFVDIYEGVYFFYASIYVDWNGTEEYEYFAYMTNYPQTWNEDWEYSDEYGIKLEEGEDE
tara:strand:+ start:427 stop:1515 length:1089 start_codon:yes stop_codon:yes gene_type:complete